MFVVQCIIRIINAVFFANIVSLAIIFFITRLNGIPRSIFPLYSLVLIFLLGGSRLIYRYVKDRKYLKFKSKQVLIIGAGSAGEILVRDLLRSTNHDYYPVGFIDDAKDKQGREIHRIRVLGTCEDISKISKQYEINLAIIALPSANAKQMRRIVEYCNAARISFQTLPSPPWPKTLASAPTTSLFDRSASAPSNIFNLCFLFCKIIFYHA